MRFLKECESWRTDDEADLYVAPADGDTPPPREFNCYVVGHTGIMRPEMMAVRTNEIEFLAAGLFGEPRGKTSQSPGWTGDAHRFGIYIHHPRHRRHEVIILRSNGSGSSVYIDVSLSANEMWRFLCANCLPDMLWNICNCVLQTHDSAYEYGRQWVMHAFLDGRLRMHRGAVVFSAHR